MYKTLPKPSTECRKTINNQISLSHLLTYFIFVFDLFPASSSASNRATSSSLVSCGMKKEEETSPQRLIIFLYMNSALTFWPQCIHSIHYLNHLFSQWFLYCVYIFIQSPSFLLSSFTGFISKVSLNTDVKMLWASVTQHFTIALVWHWGHLKDRQTHLIKINYSNISMTAH